MYLLSRDMSDNAVNAIVELSVFVFDGGVCANGCISQSHLRLNLLSREFGRFISDSFV